MKDYMCACCGVNPKQVHSFCFECHGEELGYRLEELVAKVGADHLGRCDERDCYLCQQLYGEYKGYNKKKIVNMAKGRHGQLNKQNGKLALSKIKENERIINDNRQKTKKNNS